MTIDILLQTDNPVPRLFILPILFDLHDQKAVIPSLSTPTDHRSGRPPLVSSIDKCGLGATTLHPRSPTAPNPAHLQPHPLTIFSPLVAGYGLETRREVWLVSTHKDWPPPPLVLHGLWRRAGVSDLCPTCLRSATLSGALDGGSPVSYVDFEKW